MNDIQQSMFGQYMSKAAIEDHVEKGLLCGYPDCCIKYSLLRIRGGELPVHENLQQGVVLCPECVNKSDIANIIQCRRLLKTPYPHSDGTWMALPKDMVSRANCIVEELMKKFSN